MFRKIAIAAALTVCACATPATGPACVMSDADRAWIDQSLAAWRLTAREITGVAAVRPFQAVFFDSDCALTSPNAFSSDLRAGPTWETTPHGGSVGLPNGDMLPAGVTSFASADERQAFFVMSTPSVWSAGGVRNEALGLEVMMTAVMLHEGAHVAQTSTYGARMQALVEANGLPEDFNDDSIQHRFEGDPEFAASVENEMDLFFQAAATADVASARALAQEGRDLIRARHARWFTGADAYLAEAEDIWLTFEGSGQWAAYQWIIHPEGANVPVEVAMPNFARRSRWWSQKEGLAIAMTVARLAGPDWRTQAFHDGERTLLEMLDAALDGDT